MKRIRKNKSKSKLKVDAILTADWHIRESQPTCRTDDFEEAQWDMVMQVSTLQQKYNCPVLHAGDLFDHWKPSPGLISKCIEKLPDNFATVYGNHDLPQHSIELARKCGIYTLGTGHHINILEEGHEGQTPQNCNVTLPPPNDDRKIYVWHKFVYIGKPPFPGAEQEAEGHWLLDTYPQFDLILTGDNHQSFVCKEEGRLLVNAGSLTRQNASQINYKPRVWLYNAKYNKVKPHYLKCPNGEDVISVEHLEEKKERDERILAFVEKLDTEWEADLDFLENLKKFELQNKVDKKVMEIIYKTVEMNE